GALLFGNGQRNGRVVCRILLRGLDVVAADTMEDIPDRRFGAVLYSGHLSQVDRVTIVRSHNEITQVARVSKKIPGVGREYSITPYDASARQLRVASLYLIADGQEINAACGHLIGIKRDTYLSASAADDVYGSYIGNLFNFIGERLADLPQFIIAVFLAPHGQP